MIETTPSATPEASPYRLDATVELKQPKEPDTGIDWLAWIQTLSPILLALVGLYFTDTNPPRHRRPDLFPRIRIRIGSPTSAATGSSSSP